MDAIFARSPAVTGRCMRIAWCRPFVAAAAIGLASVACRGHGRADVRVRVYDDATGHFLALSHGLILPDGSSKYAYSTDSNGSGWGPSFWLTPGSYQIEVSRFDCRGRLVFLHDPIRRPFGAKAGQTIDLTIHFNQLSIRLDSSYANLKGLTCGQLAPAAGPAL